MKVKRIEFGNISQQEIMLIQQSVVTRLKAEELKREYEAYKIKMEMERKMDLQATMIEIEQMKAHNEHMRKMFEKDV